MTFPHHLFFLDNHVDNAPPSGRIITRRHAGNTVVLKPSEMTPLSTLLFAELFEHLPPGVVNIVSGYGKECGEPLVLDPRVRVIAFTGSMATGQRIAQLVAPQMKKLHLGLGEEGLDEFRETKHVHWDFEGGKKSWWYPYGK